jgi:hypothetical protein
MYEIYSVIWGVPITDEMANAFHEREQKLDPNDEDFPASFSVDDGGWFLTLYSGTSKHEVGYLGDCISTYPCFNPPPLEEIDRKRESLTDLRKQEILEEINKLPDWLKAVMPKPGWFTVTSTS